MNSRKLLNLYCKFSFVIGLLRLKFGKKRIPLMANLIITNRCNLECFYCYVDVYNQEQRAFSLEELAGLIDTLYDRGTRLVVLLGGEPLMFKKIGELIRYIKSKKMVCEIITNGYLAGRYLDDLELCDSVCVSLDGEEEGHDLNRGKGSWEKAMQAIALLQSRHIPVRVKAVLTHNNSDSLDYLGRFAKENGIMLTVSAAATYNNRNYQQKDKWLEESEKRAFFDKLLSLKKQGVPIGYSNTALNYIKAWPYNEDYIVKKDRSNHVGKFDLLNCRRKDNSLYLDSDGSVYPCAYQWGKNAKNILVDGFDAAWEQMTAHDCYACGSLPDIDLSYMLSFNWENIFNAVKFYIFKNHDLRKPGHKVQGVESVR